MRDLQRRISVHFSGASFSLGEPGLIRTALPVIRHAGVKLVREQNALGNRKVEQAVGEGGGTHAFMVVPHFKKSTLNFPCDIPAPFAFPRPSSP